MRDEATELGLGNLASDELQNADLISGEVEIIRSKLFLNIVLDSIHVDVAHFSKGDLLNHELFTNSPYIIDYKPGAIGIYEHSDQPGRRR